MAEVRRATTESSFVGFQYRLLHGLQPVTIASYTKALKEFELFLRLRPQRPRYGWEYDEALVGFWSLQGKDHPAYLERLLAAVMRTRPVLRGRLPWTHALLQQCRLNRPPKRTTPMPQYVMMTIAARMSLHAYGRTGGVLLLQWGFGLRPSEALGPTRESLIPASDTGTAEPVLLLKGRTKAGRPQCAVGFSKHITWLNSVVAYFLRTTPPSRPLSGTGTLDQYASILRRACSDLGIVGDYTPHSPRAGWASFLRMRNVDFTELQERGRWASPASLRIYLDIINVLQLQHSELRIQHWGEYLTADFAARFPWW